MSELIEKITTEIVNSTGGGTSDPTLWGMHIAICREHAKAALRAINEAGYRVVPERLTAENGMKAALAGEFFERHRYDDEDGNEHYSSVPVTWFTIREIHKAILSAAPDTGEGTQ